MKLTILGETKFQKQNALVRCTQLGFLEVLLCNSERSLTKNIFIVNKSIDFIKKLQIIHYFSDVHTMCT